MSCRLYSIEEESQKGEVDARAQVKVSARVPSPRSKHPPLWVVGQGQRAPSQGQATPHSVTRISARARATPHRHHRPPPKKKGQASDGRRKKNPGRRRKKWPKKKKKSHPKAPFFTAPRGFLGGGGGPTSEGYEVKEKKELGFEQRRARGIRAR